MSDLCVGHIITRAGEQYDVAVYFRVTHFAPYVPATYWQPAQESKYEFEFVRAELDGASPDDPPLTPDELHDISVWWTTQYERCCEIAAENDHKNEIYWDVA